MVSRAVQRKKERREKVKAALGDDAPVDALGNRRRRAPTPPWHTNDEEGEEGAEYEGGYGDAEEGEYYEEAIGEPIAVPIVVKVKAQPEVKKHRPEVVAPVVPAKPVVSIEAAVRERLAAEGKALEEGAELTRKERRQLETARKLDKTVEKMGKVEARLQQIEEQAKAKAEEDGDCDEEAVEAKMTAMREAKERHAARHIGGTFWKTRKERKHKTLFVGNVPMGYNQHALKDVIEAVLRDNDVNTNVIIDNGVEVTVSKESLDFEGEEREGDGPASVGWGTAQAPVNPKKPFSANPTEDAYAGLYGDTCPVLTIDFLKTMKQTAKTHHAYVCFRTYEIAVAAQSLLDGMPLSDTDRPDRNKLRVNFSEDSGARSVAIAKREGSKHLRGGVQPSIGFGRGVGGGRGGFRGGGRGGARGGGGGGGFRGCD